MRKTHSSLLTPRNQDAGWAVIQSQTLLQEAIRNGNNTSFLLYSALEMRNAIEQLMFTIVCACLTTKLTPSIVERCRKKDGLFKVLDEVHPKYTLMCQFANALRAEEPRVPKVAAWDIKILKMRWLGLSAYCHSPLIAKDIQKAEWFETGQALIEKVYDYIVKTLHGTAGTGAIDTSGGPPIIRQLQDDFLAGKITAEQVVIRLRLIRPMLPNSITSPR